MTPQHISRLRRAEWDKLDAMLSIKQAKVILGWGLNQTYRAARVGAIPAIRNGRGYSIPRDRLRAWMETAEGQQAGWKPTT